ncbi:DUF3891 family protein [Pseudanabaena sp. FACHB-2040]|uniref:DUF3891 family protein n=1 Tax=Pseudanabaena sp. FACHB-2040 TaxID=2692859 RepID=UPI001687D995|nr:DUF3891 family protein [Pseudanabaena sp. FACHB-2040]MBD2260321.1 DUF3891 family protein [Pseudanabaena sp. FACHB-2040]
MIVNLQDEGWEIIYHRAHALLAAQIAGNWDRSKTPQRIYETLAAISHHDDLEKEWEEDQLTTAGAPLDFTLEREIGLEKMQRHAENALYRGRWVALLTSMHLSFLNEGRRDQDKDLAKFLDQQQQQQAQWREELGVSEKAVESAYYFMRWCDRLSLILCQQQVPEAGRQLEVQIGPDGKHYYVSQLENGSVGVTPWPFNEEKITVNVEASCLSQLKFESNDELRQALKQAPRKLLTWTFEPTAAA